MKQKSGCSINHGIDNEAIVTSVLNKYVQRLSNKAYSIEKLVDLGLLVNREVRMCITSPDGFFALFEGKAFIDRHL